MCADRPDESRVGSGASTKDGADGSRIFLKYILPWRCGVYGIIWPLLDETGVADVTLAVVVGVSCADEAAMAVLIGAMMTESAAWHR